METTWWRLCDVVGNVFLAHTLGPLIPVNHGLNARVYLRIVVDHAHLFLATIYHLLTATSEGPQRSQSKFISSWLPEHDDGFSVLQRACQLLDLNPVKHLWDVEEQESQHDVNMD